MTTDRPLQPTTPCLSVLALYGLHRLVPRSTLLARTTAGRPAPAARSAKSCQARDRAATDLQRASGRRRGWSKPTAASRLPARHRLEIQVLDDSTDATREVLAAAGRSQLALRGSRHRPRHGADDRTGYKAGRTRRSRTREAEGELVAIFDADFVPEPDFLLSQRVAALRRPDVGMVQARWGHHEPRSRPGSPELQALSLLDGHFLVEHDAGRGSGRLLQLQRHRGRVATQLRSKTPATGSTTRSPKISTSPTGRSSPAGASSSCPTSSPPPSCRRR